MAGLAIKLPAVAGTAARAAEEKRTSRLFGFVLIVFLL
jgi:hypothetical protein